MRLYLHPNKINQLKCGVFLSTIYICRCLYNAASVCHTKVVLRSFAASLFASAWLAAGTSPSRSAMRQGWFFLGCSFWRREKNVHKTKTIEWREVLARTLYLQPLLHRVVHYSMSPQTFLISNDKYTKQSFIILEIIPFFRCAIKRVQLKVQNWTILKDSNILSNTIYCTI